VRKRGAPGDWISQRIIFQDDEPKEPLRRKGDGHGDRFLCFCGRLNFATHYFPRRWTKRTAKEKRRRTWRSVSLFLWEKSNF
jgi:hypothetical protein